MDYKVDIEQGKLAREEKDSKVKAESRTHSDLAPLKIGDMCYIKEEVGVNRGQFKDLCQVRSVREHGRGKSYYVENIENGPVYLRNWNKLKISKSETEYAGIIQEMPVKFEITENIKSCLKR